MFKEEDEMRRNSILTCGASALALFAQSAAAQSANSTPGVPSSAAESEANVGDIIVTEQRREQKLKDVPITIRAIGVSTLQNTGDNGVQQIQSVTPNLIDYTSVDGAIPFVRGIGFSYGDPAPANTLAIE